MKKIIFLLLATGFLASAAQAADVQILIMPDEVIGPISPIFTGPAAKAPLAIRHIPSANKKDFFIEDLLFVRKNREEEGKNPVPAERAQRRMTASAFRSVQSVILPRFPTPVSRRSRQACEGLHAERQPRRVYGG